VPLLILRAIREDRVSKDEVCVPDAAQRVSGALLIRDLSTLTVRDDPGSAKQRYTLHRARDTAL
jgi:hypothetical protein